MKSKKDKEGDIELAIAHCEARVAAKKRHRGWYLPMHITIIVNTQSGSLIEAGRLVIKV